MRGASRESQQAAIKEMEAQINGDPAQADQFGPQLYAISRLVRTNVSLRRALTDPSRSADAKAGLLHHLLGGKVSDGALAAATTAVRGRWSSTRDLPQALETMSVHADISTAGRQGQLDDVEDQLFRLERLLRSETALNDTLQDASYPTESRQQLLSGILEHRAADVTVRLAARALEDEEAHLGDKLLDYQQMVADARDRGLATVTVAAPLTEQQRDQLVSVLSRRYGRTVHLNEIVNPQVLGGMLVEIGDDVIDGTVRSKLTDARRKIAG